MSIVVPNISTLKAENVDNISLIYDSSIFTWTNGNFVGQADNLNIIQSNLQPLSVGAWVRQTAQAISYKLPAQAAKPQSQADKNEQIVDLFDALSPAMRASVRNGEFVDIGPAVQAIMNFASGGENTSSNMGGTTLHIKGGRYFTSTPFNNTFRYDHSIIDDGDLRRLNLKGDGSNNTTIFYNGPANSPAYYVRGHRGTVINDGVEMRHTIEGIRFRRNPINQKLGTGVRIQHSTHVMMRDVVIDGFDLGLSLQDVIGFSAEELQVLTSNVGIRAELGDFTHPNVLRFIGGAVSGASDIGIHLVRAANALIDSMRFEANGNDPDNSFTILCELGTPEGGASLTVRNSYFENNQGNADLQMAFGHAYDAMIDVSMNTFHRSDDTRFVKHHIDVARTGAAETANVNLTLNHGPQRYRNLGNYVSDPTRSAVRIQTPGIWLVENPGNRYPTDNERPQTNGFPMIGSTYPIVSAAVNADGSFNDNPADQVNVFSIDKTNIGEFRINLRNSIRNPAAAKLIAGVTENPGFATVTSRDPAGRHFKVETRNIAGSLIDLPFVVNGLGAFL